MRRLIACLEVVIVQNRKERRTRGCHCGAPHGGIPGLTHLFVYIPSGVIPLCIETLLTSKPLGPSCLGTAYLAPKRLHHGSRLEYEQKVPVPAHIDTQRRPAPERLIQHASGRTPGPVQSCPDPDRQEHLARLCNTLKPSTISAFIGKSTSHTLAAGYR